jgi:hypothetical protein
MPVIVKNLVPAAQLTAAVATYYTAVNVKALLDKCTLCNTSGAAVTVDLHLVPSAGAASASNKVLDTVSVNSHTTYVAPEVVGHVLEAGSTIQALASAATAVSLRVSGREVS